MALEGEQGGEKDEKRGADGPARVDGLSDHLAPGDSTRQGPAAHGDYSASAAPAVSGPLGSAHRTGSRSRSFAYDTKVFQGENLTYVILTQPSQGWVTDNGDGTFSFDPGLDFQDLKSDESRRISFSYQASDGWSGAETASASLTVTGTADGTLEIELVAERPSRRSESGETVSPAGGAPQPAPEPEPPEPSAAAPAEALPPETLPPETLPPEILPPEILPPEILPAEILPAERPWDTTEHAASGGAGDHQGAAAAEVASSHDWADGLEPAFDAARDDSDNGQGLDEPAVSVPDDSADAETAARMAAEGEDVPLPAWESEPASIPDAIGQGPVSGGEDPRPGDLDAFVAEPEPTSKRTDLERSAPDGDFRDEEATWAADPAPPGTEPAMPEVDTSAEMSAEISAEMSTENRGEPYPGSPGSEPAGENPAEDEPTDERTDLARSALGGEFQDEQADWAVDPVPTGATPTVPDVELSAAVSDETRDGPYPVGSGAEPDGDDMRYTILAQPPEGQVSATANGEFEFTPGADFPNLEIGELHQVSFTCEAVDGQGATSIVIASLTITGTSESPEICDVSFRRAQASSADHGAGTKAGETPADAATGTVETDSEQWADPAASGASADAESDGPGTEWQDEPKPDHGGGLSSGLNEEFAASGLNEDPPFGNQADSAAALPAQPAWPPDPGDRADVADPDRPREETTSWQTAARMEPETQAQGTDTAGAPDTLDQEPALDVGPASHQGDAIRAAPVEGEQSVAPLPGDPAADLSIGDPAFPVSGLEPAEAEMAAGLGQDPGPGAEDSAGGGTPADPTDVPVAGPYSEHSLETEAESGSESPGVSDPFGEPQAEPEAVAGHEDKGHFAEDYRGAVAPEAVATPLPGHPDGGAEGQPEEDLGALGLAEDMAPEPAIPEEIAPAVAESDRQAIDLDDIFPADAGGTPAQTTAEPHQDGETHPDRNTLEDVPSVMAEVEADDPSAARADGAADDPAALEDSHAAVEDEFVPIAAQAEEPGLTLVAADEEEDEATELSDFTLSQRTVVEKCEAGTLVGQVLVAGAQEGSRFIFDLQNDAGGRFDINPRTGKVTVADGALLDHAAADSHDILVQVIAHSGVSCRKTLTINVVPAGSDQAAASEPDAVEVPSEVAEAPPPQARESDASREPAVPLESEREIYPFDGGKVGRHDEEIAGGGDVDTLHLDGVSGGPGSGGWSIELTEGQIVETKDDHVRLSKDSSGNVMLDGCPVKVAFQGVKRIEW